MAGKEKDEAFTAFVSVAFDGLSRLAIALTGSRQTGEDLLQDALLRVYTKWHVVEPGKEVAFTRRVLANLATDRWRRRRYEVPLSVGTDRGAPDPGFAGVDDRDQIVRQLATLSPRERTIVVLRHYADLSEAQVAAELGVSVGTVKSTCSRALARLSLPGAPRTEGSLR